MKKFIIDQVLFLIVGIGIMICIPLLCGPKSAFLFEIVVVISWGFLCRRVLLLPFDLIYGKVTRFVYFSTQLSIGDYELFAGKHYPEWKFSYDNKTLVLMVPIAATIEEIHRINRPKQDEKLRITFFYFSKILLDYEPVSLTS